MRKEIWEMAKEDEKFSMILIEKVSGVAKSLKVEDLIIEISEKYDDEKTPHFHMKVGFGSTIDLPADNMLISYTASQNSGINYVGSIYIEVCANAHTPIGKILATLTFGLYDDAIRQFYPEWKTDYNVNSIKLNPVGNMI